MFHYYIEPKIIPNLLTEYEIEYIKKEAIPYLTKSRIANNVLDTDLRTSDSTCLNPSDPIVNSILKRCASIVNKPITNCELLQVIRYNPGGFYVPHQDTYDAENLKRLYTFILVLNDDYEGGETAFPNLDVKYKMKKGDCLFFHTLDNHKQITKLALHSGQPVKTGYKWICNLWIQEDSVI